MSTQEPTERQVQNVALMTRLMNYVNDAGLGRLAERAESFIHPEIEFRPTIVTYEKPVYTGMAEYLKYLRKAADDGQPGSYLNLREVRPVGEDSVLALAYVHHESPDGGVFDSDYALLGRVQDGLLRELRSFASIPEAERAADA